MSHIAEAPMQPLGLANKKCKLECWGTASKKSKKSKKHKLGEEEESNPTLRCITKDLHLTLSSSEIRRFRRENTERLLQENKLILVLALDDTLLHTVDSNTLTPEEELLLLPEEDGPNEVIFEWDGMATKLRPHVSAFLKEASKMYDMYIYTMGCREYALQMARPLDPDGVYFESKVISREDCTEPGKKGLHVVLGEKRVAVVLDDNNSVWAAHPKNLLLIDRYRFFGSGRESKYDCALGTKRFGTLY